MRRLEFPRSFRFRRPLSLAACLLVLLLCSAFGHSQGATASTKDRKTSTPYTGDLTIFIVPATKLSALADLGTLAFVEPIVITRERTVIDGYARWELARLQGRPTLLCVEYELADAEALQWLLRRHRRSNGLNDFCRILLALKLEPAFREKALLNQKAGSHQGSSKLTKAGPLDVRSEIAKVAGVSDGNVTKVKQLATSAHPEVLAALRSGEIRIHRAWKWSKESLERQITALRLYRDKGLHKTIRGLISRHKPQNRPTTIDPRLLLDLLSTLSQAQLASVGVSIIPGSIPAIFVTEALLQSFQPFQESIPTWAKNSR